ncbi:HAMP domain-containing histidine kinase [Oscillospiraceae bacterium NSJ-64]|uniref:histidine kinase n=1 Tax=Youxingia wuxianensis TaxID=2763678 RepID=A0A926EQZ5_9FIRM|nr:HAMP domain-containing histidine kinase [Youxingia wuxianensis]
MKSSAASIRKTYEENSDTFYTEINQIENKNAFVSLLSVDEETGALVRNYYSRVFKDQVKPWDEKAPAPPENFPGREEEDKWLLELLPDLDESYTILQPEDNTPGKNDFTDKIGLATRLDDNLYLLIETPKGYLKSTADLAVKYTAYLSIVILLAGSVLVYLVVGRVTKPLSKIQEVADKISKMDFSQKCKITSQDEIGLLAVSINNMSDELQANIDKLVQANEILQNDLLRQQQTDRMRQQFIANVSHDFKTPLTLMISYAEALEEGETNPQKKEYCDIIISESHKMSYMVGKLLSLSKLESGTDKLETSIFCLNEVISQVVNSHRILTSKKDIKVEIDADLDVIVNADYQKIGQVVTNLFENAVKYTPQQGRISLSGELSENRCRVSVVNTGSRIAKEDQENLFISFYRADKSRSRDLQSYGLGLAIVKAIMQLHGQEYGVENTPDGVRFWFDLELADIDNDD